MKKIICAFAPNPALDMSGSVDKIILNEKTYVHDPLMNPGGNSINVARILKRLRIPVQITGFIGGGIGQEICKLLDDEKVANEFLPIRGSSRISVTVANRKDHNQTRLTFPGPQIRAVEKEKLFSWFRAQKNISYLVIGGSLPPGFSEADVVKLIRYAKRSGIPVVLDCPGRILKKTISAGPLLIKPNLLEFQELSGKNVRSIQAVKKAAQVFLNQVSIICVSSVEGGTLLMNRDECFFGKIAPVSILSTVGAGDSMVGAMVSRLAANESSLAELLRWGLAASAATLATSGTNLGQADSIRRLYRQTSVERI